MQAGPNSPVCPAEGGLNGLLELVDPAEQVVKPEWRRLDHRQNWVRSQRAWRCDQQARANCQARQLRRESRDRQGRVAARLQTWVDAWRATAR